MLRQKKLISVPISFLIVLLGSVGNAVKASSLGVDIYCVMRQGGNSHEASWNAAYQSIKSERSGLFKTSPRQGATMIVQAVVRNTDKYGDCVQYLGDLYPLERSKDPTNKVDTPIKEKGQKSNYIEERYNY